MDNITQQLTTAIGKTIKDKRSLLSLSIKGLSDVSHVSTTVITDIENARSLPKISVLVKLAKALNIPLSQLFQAEIKVSEKPVESLDEALKSYGLSSIDSRTAMDFINYLKNKEHL